jgi:hypothetical protein
MTRCTEISLGTCEKAGDEVVEFKVEDACDAVEDLLKVGGEHSATNTDKKTDGMHG